MEFETWQIPHLLSLIWYLLKVKAYSLSLLCSTNVGHQILQQWWKMTNMMFVVNSKKIAAISPLIHTYSSNVFFCCSTHLFFFPFFWSCQMAYSWPTLSEFSQLKWFLINFQYHTYQNWWTPWAMVARIYGEW